MCGPGSCAPGVAWDVTASVGRWVVLWVSIGLHERRLSHDTEDLFFRCICCRVISIQQGLPGSEPAPPPPTPDRPKSRFALRKFHVLTGDLGTERFCFGWQGVFFAPSVCTPNAQSFMEVSHVYEKHESFFFFDPPPSPHLNPLACLATPPPPLRWV